MEHLFEISISISLEWSEIVAGYLFEVGATAVEERADDRGASLVTHLPEEGLNGKLAALGKFLAGIAHEMGFDGELPRVEVRKIEDRAWAREARDAFKPVLIAGNYWAAPTWTPKDQLPEGDILLIDPGEAFGTGMHSSTRLAATLMLDVLADKTNVRLLDVGTGTGVLAMLAFRAGAKPVTAFDTDPRAIEVAAENIMRNNCRIDLKLCKIEEISGQFDMIVANILLETLLEMAPQFKRLLSPNGVVIMSGLLVEQGSWMRTKMQDIGMGLPEKELIEEGWLALRCRL